MSSNTKINRYFWFITVSIVFILTLPTLIQDGMFMDGELYTAVSHNLANGIGTFWFPSFSYHNLAGIKDSFHEQPPLVFGIQALFFKMFGDSMYVEIFYVFITIILNIYLIKKLWETFFSDNEKLRSISWLPVVFWIGIPVCFWSYSYNMHENTVSIFTLSSVLFFFKALRSPNTINRFILVVISAVFVFLASFSKGLPGLFPLALPIILGSFNYQLNFKTAIINTFIMLGVVVGIYGLLLINKEAKESLSIYFFDRLLKRVNDVPTTDYYLDTLWRLCQEILLDIGLIILIKRTTRKFELTFKPMFKESLLLFCIGLAGVLPLMLTLVQKGFYMVPALPFIGMSLAILVAYDVSYLVNERMSEQKNGSALKFISIIAIISTLIFTATKVGKISRDKITVKDVHVLGGQIPKHSIINCSEDMLNDWPLQTYLSRYYFISLDTDKKRTYLVCSKTVYNSDSSKYNKEHVKIPSQMELYYLLKSK
ncbi:MAG: ArnT family glycosyltransferase [Sphingobacteriaceae bacterium]